MNIIKNQLILRIINSIIFIILNLIFIKTFSGFRKELIAESILLIYIVISVLFIIITNQVLQYKHNQYLSLLDNVELQEYSQLYYKNIVRATNLLNISIALSITLRI